MLIEKLKSKKGLRLTFEKPFSLRADNNNFSIQQNLVYFGFNQAILNSTTIELYFSNDPLLPPDQQPIFDELNSFRLKINTQNYSYVNDLVYDLLPFVGISLVIDGNLDNSTELDFDFEVLKNEQDEFVLFPDFVNDGTLKDSRFDVTIKEYKLHLFDDFPEKVYKLSKVVSDTDDFVFGFKKNFVYKIEVNFVPDVDVDYKKLKKVKTVLPIMPTNYFSSVYQIKNLLEELELEINLFNGVESQLQIWKYSEMAFAKAGFLDTSIETLTESDFMILSNYVSYKIILQKYMASFLSLTLEQSNKESNQAQKGLKLGEFEVKGIASPQEMISSLNTFLRNIENEIKEISFRKSFAVVEKIVSVETRNSLLYPNKRSVIQVVKKNGNKYFGTWW